MSEKLKPCPFCGGRAGGPGVISGSWQDQWCSGTEWYTSCASCGGAALPVDSWNRRAPTTIEEAMSVPEVRALVEQMADAMERVVRRGGLTVEYHEALRDARAMLLAAEKPEEGR